MAEFLVCHTLLQDLLFGNKGNLTSAALIEGNNTHTMLYAFIPTLTVALATISSSMARYLKDDLQQIFRTVLYSRLSASPLALAPAPQQYKSPYERLLKAEFLDLYQDKYNIIVTKPKII